MSAIINLKTLRENMLKYTAKVSKGQSFIVFKRSRPIFKISPVGSAQWEELIDFTKIKKGGVSTKELLRHL